MKRHPEYGLYGDKIIHRAAQVNPYGGVSALCFKKPRAINLKMALWSIRDPAVTCKKCIKIL